MDLSKMKPINPIGQCFDSAGIQFINQEENPFGTVLCHGIGVANLPGQEGMVMGHAWLEAPSKKGMVALDTTWGIRVPASVYRRTLKLDYVVQYTMEEVRELWTKWDHPGPWDEKIKAAIIEGKKQREERHGKKEK